MQIFRLKKIPVWCLFLLSTPSFAEGIVDIKPYISTAVNYDDNLFRLSSPEQAKAVLGSSNRSDVVKRLDLGLEVNLKLSRQLISFVSSLSESKYSHFSNLDNTGSANSLRWDWHFGSNFYGVLSTNRNEAIASFNEVRSPVKNIRISSGQSASVNWNFHPDWTVFVSGEHDKFNNAAASSVQLDREDDILEGGIRFNSPLNTQLAISYRQADSAFPNRVGFTKSTLGSESSQKEIVVAAAWQPASKTRLSTRLSHVNLQRQDSLLSDFNGFSKQLGLDYSATEKVNFNIAAYQVVSPVDDVVSTYVKTTGLEINPSWRVTSKVFLRGNLSYSENAYIGSAAISTNNVERLEQSTQAGLSLIYTPTLKSLVQLQYLGEKRESNITDASYLFNNINFVFRYNF